jgi:hypothetical protein
MKKDFSLSNGKAMINFTAKYCDTTDKLLESNGFKRVISSYFKKIKKRNSLVYKYITNSMIVSDEEVLVEELINLFKLMTIIKNDDIITLNNKYEKILSDKDRFIDFIEGLYSFWRKLERYTIVTNTQISEGYESVNFIDANNEFAKLVLNLYRRIEENVLQVKPNVYRQLPVGGNAGLILRDISWPIPEEYKALSNIPFLDSIMLNLPFITYPKKNTRDGYFTECFENPLEHCNIYSDHWFCYPAKVGTLLAYIYFHRDYMAQGLTLCNLFEMARENECTDKKPDLIYIFGARDDFEKPKTIFYDDVKNNIMLGYVSYSDAIDYFGYMKKMALTLHNLVMIKRGCLPVHGAMVNIVLNNGKAANVVIVGDSGAGKSESLEAFRSLSEDYISDMTIIFDDMGYLKLNGNKKPLGYGTEIGAFVRLDDLGPGYAFKEIDRCIFMNPDKINARLVMPVSSYKDIIKGYEIDMFLYANNYESVDAFKEEIEYLNSPDEALEVFKEGVRMAKGTTTESGLVKSYFANPFGPHQKQKETDILLVEYFNSFYQTGVKVGQIRTCLGIEGEATIGPKRAAKKLFEEIKKL